MLDIQGEFFRDMKPMRIKSYGPRLTIPERDCRIVELRKDGISVKKIAREVRCSPDTACEVLARDWPEGLPQSRKDAPRAGPAEQLLALPPTDGEPLAKIGVHFWDLPVHGQCKFIVARDPDDKLARFCGETTVMRGCSWCAEHLAIVAQPKRKFIAEAA